MNSALPFKFAQAIPGLQAFTSTRKFDLGMNTGQDPAFILSQRHALWAELGLELGHTAFLKQVHSEGLQAVGLEARGRGVESWEQALPDCDLAIATEPGLLLAVGHADCLAILLVDPQTRICGAAHAGWRGASLRVAAKLAATMSRDYGSEPSRMLAGLSVCLGPCHLELGPAQLPLFKKRTCKGPFEQGRFFLDLRHLAHEDLMDCGLKAENIEWQNDCTWDRNDLYFSHRKEQGKAGRQMSVIGFKA